MNMNRRGFIGAVLGAAVAPFVPRVKGPYAELSGSRCVADVADGVTLFSPGDSPLVLLCKNAEYEPSAYFFAKDGLYLDGRRISNWGEP